MALRLAQLLLHNPKSFGSENRRKYRVYTAKLSRRERGSYRLVKNYVPNGLISGHCSSSRCISSGALSSLASAYSDQSCSGDEALVTKAGDFDKEFNRVDCLVSVLHESARSFSVAVESLDWLGSGPELAMAWVGRDVHGWHKRIAYQVAVYSLLKTAIEVEVLLSHERCMDPSPVREILTPKVNMVGEYIEKQLTMKDPRLVEWFRVVEQPRIAGFFIPMLKNWSMEYAGSGVAGVIVAISCCTAVENLGSGRISCPLFTFSVADVLIKLMSYSHGLVPLDKLHHLATEAGFEFDFLSHFGANVLPNNNIEELEFWIGLAHNKLSIAFERESLSEGMCISHDKALLIQNRDNCQKYHEVQADSLATLGIFAYLGRRTLIFLSKVGIKNVDELVKDFLSYLECGSLFIYPEFSSISTYQLFIEIIMDEIGWLDFYAGFPFARSQEKRPKKHANQAETEIILSRVFTVCYDVFSGFAHFCRSSQLPMDSNLLAFLLRSQSLLTVCLEDYWAAYDGSGSLGRIAEADGSMSIPSMAYQGNAKTTLDAQHNQSDLTTKEHPEIKSTLEAHLRKATGSIRLDAKPEGASTEEATILRESFLRKNSTKLISVSHDIWTGTQLLFFDLTIAMKLLLKQLRGQKVTKREGKKLKRTLSDIVTLVPITILMILPVSALGHAAMLAAIKRYAPCLIPSPYSSERLDIMKHLKRTKKMDAWSWSSPEDASYKPHK